MTVVYSKAALRDLDAILSYAGWHDRSAKLRLVDRINEVTNVIDHHPLIGGTVGYRGIRRMFINPYPYAILYRFSGEIVSIVRIRHTARRPLLEPNR